MAVLYRIIMPPNVRFARAFVFNVPGEMARKIESLVDRERETKSDVLRDLLEAGLRSRGLE
jgi:hypothetical protein